MELPTLIEAYLFNKQVSIIDSNKHKYFIELQTNDATGSYYRYLEHNLDIFQHCTLDGIWHDIKLQKDTEQMRLV